MKTHLFFWTAAAVFCVCATAHAADGDKSPIGPVTIEFTDQSTLTGVLMDISDVAYIIRTADGVRTIDRTRVRKLEPVVLRPPVAAEQKVSRPAEPAKEAAASPEDIRIAKAPELGNDLPDEELPNKRGKAAAARRELAPEDADLLRRIRIQQEPPARVAEPVERPKVSATGAATADRAFAQIEERDYKGAALTFKQIVKTGNNEEIGKADQFSRQRFNRALPEMMVMCYAQHSCVGCRGEGVLKCNACNGTGYVNKNIAANPNPTTGIKSVALSAGRARIAICESCRGNGMEVCMQCLGTRMSYPDPTVYEREAFSSYCLKLGAEALCMSEGNYGDTARESLPTVMPGGDGAIRRAVEQTWLRDSADRVKSDIFRLWRVEGFYRMALKSDPGLPLRYNAKDLSQELNKINIRRQSLYSELAERCRFQDFRQEE